MLRISENVGEEPGSELDTRQRFSHGGCLLVQAALGSDLAGWGAPPSWMLGNEG